MTLDVVVCGGHMLPFGSRRDGSTPRDWVRRAVAGAYEDTAVDPDDVDLVVVASESDHLSLQLAPGPLMVDEIGLVPRPVVRVESGGASGAAAIRVAISHLMSGLARCVLAIGYEHAASHLAGDDVRFLYGISFDSDLEGMAGATATALYALSMSAHCRRFGTTEADLAAVSVKNHGNALHNPNAHKPMAITVEDVLASRPVNPPYKLLDCSPLSDGAAAAVLMRSGAAPRRDHPRVRIAGTGCATDFARLGDRPEPDRFEGKARAAAQAYAMAGIEARSLDVIELYDAYSGAELQALEALGVAEPGRAAARLRAGDFNRGGRLPVNLSGGLIGQGGAPGAVGIAQLLTLERLLSGRYWPELQPRSDLRYGLMDTHAAVATLNFAHVLERVD
ncbi:MAG: thiolase family protein [Hyphomicrobiaceae bacterium]|nr:thiolase family protein [Hyphomicrobiaceae bacterium]